MQLLHGEKCPCGKIHDAGFDRMTVGRGAVRVIADEVRRLGGTRVCLLADENTLNVGGTKVKKLLEGAGIPVALAVLPAGVEPDEAGVAAALEQYDPACDLIVGVGSGVVNDLGKCFADTAGVPYLIVATAPSMDGYASNTAAMVVNGLKVSLPRRCASVLIGDTDLLATARMADLAPRHRRILLRTGRRSRKRGARDLRSKRQRTARPRSRGDRSRV